MAKRATRWVDTLLNLSVGNGVQFNVSLTPDLSPGEMSGITLTRTILCYTIAPSTPTSASGQQVVDIGLGMAQDEALAAGVLPDIQSNIDHPMRGWWYRCRHLISDETTVGPIQYRETYHDLKAMRKFGQGEDAFLQVFSTSRQGTAYNVAVVGIIRSLYLL